MPRWKTYKTKLIITSAYHVIASFCFLYKHWTFWTSFPLLKIKLKILVALTPLMLSHHTLLTEYCFTLFTLWWNFPHVYYSFIACFNRAQFKIRVFHSLMPQLLLFVEFLIFLRKVLICLRRKIKFFIAFFFRTKNFFHGIDFINQVIQNTLLAKRMLTIWQRNSICYFHQADGAIFFTWDDVLEFIINVAQF